MRSTWATHTSTLFYAVLGQKGLKTRVFLCFSQKTCNFLQFLWNLLNSLNCQKVLGLGLWPWPTPNGLVHGWYGSTCHSRMSLYFYAQMGIKPIKTRVKVTFSWKNANFLAFFLILKVCSSTLFCPENVEKRAFFLLFEKKMLIFMQFLQIPWIMKNNKNIKTFTGLRPATAFGLCFTLCSRKQMLFKWKAILAWHLLIFQLFQLKIRHITIKLTPPVKSPKYKTSFYKEITIIPRK